MSRSLWSRLGGGRTLRLARTYLLAALAVALVSLPVAIEQAVERASISDAVGTLPVEVSLCRQGRLALETGVLGDVYWAEAGPAGWGVRARVTGPPVAGGTLASYADRRFIQANLEFVQRPETALAAYAAEFRSHIATRVLVTAGVAGLVGGLLLVVLLRVVGERPRRAWPLVGVTLAAFLASAAGGYVLFQRWPCNGDPGFSYGYPDVPELSFSSPQTREIALQIKPFIEKNTSRIQGRAEEYEAAAVASFRRQLARRAGELEPRAGEVVVVAEADPQGAFVGTTVRERLYPMLWDRLGTDVVAMRTISGDITSNGTVAEDRFVAEEAAAAGDEVPTVAVAGDHDSEATWVQMREHGMGVPDLATEEVSGLLVSGANDVEHKALFGQLVTNDSGITERELGARLRDVVPEDRAGVVLLHQPEAVAGYLGLDSLAEVRAASTSLTTPSDDGIPDVPPGTVNIGHLHDLDGPWVLWNTDGEDVTWTVVDQLGTTGGVEENSTFNRFSTPVSVPLKPLAWRLQYVDADTGLQTGYATVICDVTGACTISGRTDVGVPLTEP